MLGRKRTGSVLCPACGRLVGVNDKECLSCGRRNPGMWGLTGVLRGLGRDAGFVQLVLGAAILLYGATLLLDTGGIQSGGLSFLQPSSKSLFAFGASGAIPVFVYHHWWTVLSAGWLHAGVLHILFNMLWVRQLAPETAELYGPSRMVIIYTLSSVAGFLLTSLVGAFLPFLGGARFTVGASASLFGLLAALVYYGRRAGSRHLGSQAWSYAIVLFVMGFLPGFAADNWAHLGGFAGGYLVAKWLDPLLPERGDHVLGAVACLAASALAIVASLVTAHHR
ncbi:MAG TPA: rhomboid family intramembrane serine protease [Thermoanaerobaculia bacterium]|nr:rhomboid family intramembrane serine protease [Thermoanaerobaculia bacterium]